jgi:hypothetical protein
LLMLKHHIGSSTTIISDMQNITQQGAEGEVRMRIQANFRAGLSRLENLNELLKSIKQNPENMGLLLYQDFL